MQNIIFYFLCVLIWGSTWFAVKFQLGSVDPLLSIAYRFFLAGIFITIYARLSGRFKNFPFDGTMQFHIALQGFLLFFLNYWMFYVATHSLTSGLVAVCFATIPIMNGINQFLFLKIPLRKQVMLGGILGISGIALVFWPEFSHLSLHQPRIFSFTLCLIATYITSLGNISSMHNSRHHLPIIPTNALAMLYGGAFSFAAALLYGALLAFDTSTAYVLSLAYLTIFGSAVAFLLYLTLIARIGADRAGYASVLFPIVALLISTIFEGYLWTGQAIAGIFLIVIGNVLALKKPKAV